MLSRLLLARSIRNHASEDSGDPYWDKVVALSHLDGDNNSLRLMDTVTRPSPIAWTTVSGAVASTTDYIFAGSSFHFDGINGDIHTDIITDNVLAADFTIEGWANVDDLTQARCFFDTRVTIGVSNAIALAVETNGKVYFYTALDNTIHYGTVVVSAGSWFHWALCRSNGVIYLFVNGAIALTLANTTIFNTGRMMLGRSIDASGFRWKGYIQEFRCLPYVAIYTTAFTPPTSPYASAINSESHLLHLQGIAGATTVVNDANIFIPAWEPHTTGPKLSTTAARFGGSSASFTGPMCMLQSPAAQYAMGGGDFTWELFFRYSSLNAYQTLICNRTNNGSHADQITVGIEADGRVYVYSNTMLVEIASGVAANTWAHIALSVQATVGRLFVNGVQVGSNFTCPTLANTGISVGANMDRTESLLGYIDEVRITKGVARYTSNFTPPTAPFPDRGAGDPYWDHVQSLLYFEGVNGGQTFTDEKGLTWVADGAAVTSTAQTRFGNSSLYVPSGAPNGIHQTSPIAAAGTQDFTLECFFFLLGSTARILDTYPRGSTVITNLIIQPGVSSSTIYDNGNIITGAGTSANVWHHAEVSRVDGIMRFFIDGALIGSPFTGPARNYNFNAMYLGMDTYGHNGSNCYIDMFRYTLGVGRHSAPFTPPTAPFPNHK